VNPLDLREMARAATTRPSAEGHPKGETVLDRPSVLAQDLQTSLRVPLGKAVVVGGMTIEPGIKRENGPLLLVVVEVFAE
jgi:hypothetical protein